MVVVVCTIDGSFPVQTLSAYRTGRALNYAQKNSGLRRRKFFGYVPNAEGLLFPVLKQFATSLNLQELPLAVSLCDLPVSAEKWGRG